MISVIANKPEDPITGQRLQMALSDEDEFVDEFVDESEDEFVDEPEDEFVDEDKTNVFLKTEKKRARPRR